MPTLKQADMGAYMEELRAAFDANPVITGTGLQNILHASGVSATIDTMRRVLANFRKANGRPAPIEAAAAPQARRRIRGKQAMPGQPAPIQEGSGWLYHNFDAVKELLEQGASARDIHRRLGGDPGKRQIRTIKLHIAAGTKPEKPLEHDRQAAMDSRATGATQEEAGEAGGMSRRSFRALEQSATPSAEAAWHEEHGNAFRIQTQHPPFKKLKRHKNADAEWEEQDWAAIASWTFCPDCGRRRPDGKLAKTWEARKSKTVCVKCTGGCDFDPITLETEVARNGDDEPDDFPRPERPQPKAKSKAKARLKTYVTPQKEHWNDRRDKDFNVFQELTHAEACSLAPLDIKCDYITVKGGNAPVGNKKKTGVVRAAWRKNDVELGLTDKAKVAFTWLCDNNSTYKGFIEQHRALIQESKPDDDGWRVILTAQLLLHMHGVEVAARPWLYPNSAYGDSDIRSRLQRLGRISSSERPSLKASFFRKLLSRCQDYQEDFPLFALLYDIALARQINALVKVAHDQKLAPDEAAKGMQNFSAFWDTQRAQLEDMCRQNGMPNLFFTVAPAEWKFQLHQGMFGHCSDPKELSKAQAAVTMHMYHVLNEIIEKLVLNMEQQCKAPGIKSVKDYSLRFEFQGRGTLHIHVVGWVEYENKAEDLSGRTGQSGMKSRLLSYLEKLFAARVDVQCQKGEHCLMRYVTGYTSKASDALEFKRNEWSQSGSAPLSQWRQVYRLLCKKAPLEPEMTLEFATVPMMKASFRGTNIHAPLPWSETKRSTKQVNRDRHRYLAYLGWRRTLPGTFNKDVSFLAWYRLHGVELKEVDGKVEYDIKARGQRGAGSNKASCAVGISFPFELLDIYIGAFCATFVPHSSEDEFLLPDSQTAKVPDGATFLQAALQHKWIRARAAKQKQQQVARARVHSEDSTKKVLDQIVLDWLIEWMVSDLKLRGLPRSRIRTFSARVRACALLLQATERGEIDVQAWNAKSIKTMPQRTWSPQQAEVLEAAASGVACCDANVAANSRVLLVTGGPGTGKTEVVMQCAMNAAADGCKVLIACPTGALVATYRERLPPHEEVFVETVHGSFRITRDADAQYVPPGRLRHFDLIVFDETSQLDNDVWDKVRTALAELSPGPYTIFVGDFQQLQPVTGVSSLQQILLESVQRGALRHIALQQHEFARSKDPKLLDFLAVVRQHQPSRAQLRSFFGDRILSSDPAAAVAKAMEIEACLNKQTQQMADTTIEPLAPAAAEPAGSELDDPAPPVSLSNSAPARLGAEAPQRCVTFLTVTNKGAAALNAHRLAKEFPAAAASLKTRGLPADNSAGGGPMVFEEGMRVRLTRNLDKERGFVNGALGTIVKVLRRDVFVLKTTQGVHLLVHPVHDKDELYMPCVYGYSMTIRRAQGATLDCAILHFDRKRPDRGYAYVGASRVREAGKLVHMGKLRRTDWLPVGKDPNGDEEIFPSRLSDSESESEYGEDSESEEQSADEEPSNTLQALLVKQQASGDADESEHDENGEPSMEFGRLLSKQRRQRDENCKSEIESDEVLAFQDPLDANAEDAGYSHNLS
jgi:hypothetical protein